MRIYRKKVNQKCVFTEIMFLNTEKAFVYMYIWLFKFIKGRRNKFIHYAKNQNLTFVYERCILMKHNEKKIEVSVTKLLN